MNPAGALVKVKQLNMLQTPHLTTDTLILCRVDILPEHVCTLNISPTLWRTRAPTSSLLYSRTEYLTVSGHPVWHTTSDRSVSAPDQVQDAALVMTGC